MRVPARLTSFPSFAVHLDVDNPRFFGMDINGRLPSSQAAGKNACSNNIALRHRMRGEATVQNATSRCFPPRLRATLSSKRAFYAPFGRCMHWRLIFPLKEEKPRRSED